jgi:biopolymer transport protein ExbB/TolQ
MVPKEKIVYNSKLEEVAVKATEWIGSTASLIVHTLIFAMAIMLGLFGIVWDEILLILTTIVSLEAIYLSIFIQMTVNRNTRSLNEVGENIDELQEDVGEIQEDVDELQEDVGEISEVDKSQDQKEQEEKIILETIKNDMKKLTDDLNKFKENKK